MQSDEIIWDLQSAQTSATLRGVDSRSKDCGNDEVFYRVRKRWQCYTLQIPAQETAGMAVFFFMINYLAGHPGNFVAMK
jgi:hypothetical protein